MTLTEIIDEHDWREVLIAGLLPGSAKADECRARDAFARRHLARLVAVAKAAVEMREAQAFYFGRHSIESDADHGSTRLADATAAFDAAVRGEEEGEKG